MARPTAVRVLFRCVLCRALAERGFDACPSCGMGGACIPYAGPDPDEEGAHDGDPCRSLLDYDEEPVPRLRVCEPWHSLLGPAEHPGLAMPDEGCSVLVYGSKGSYKTTLLLELAASIEDSVWVPVERGMGASALRAIASRIGFGLPASLRIVDPLTLDETCSALRARQRRAVFVDSLSVYQHMGINPMEAWLALREATPGAALFGVLHATKRGKMRGSEELAHECDTIVNVSRARILISQKNRFGPMCEVPNPRYQKRAKLRLVKTVSRVPPRP